jgi:hypothetical protein
LAWHADDVLFDAMKRKKPMTDNAQLARLSQWTVVVNVCWAPRWLDRIETPWMNSQVPILSRDNAIFFQAHKSRDVSSAFSSY